MGLAIFKKLKLEIVILYIKSPVLLVYRYYGPKIANCIFNNINLRTPTYYY